MRTVSFYDAATGEFWPGHLQIGDAATDADEVVALNTPPGHAAIDGLHDAQLVRVDIATGEIVSKAPPAGAAWDADARRYVDPVAIENGAARSAILALEGQQPRALRELALGYAGARERLQKLDDEIAAHRARLR